MVTVGAFLPARRAVSCRPPRPSRALASSRHCVMAQAPPLTATAPSGTRRLSGRKAARPRPRRRQRTRGPTGTRETSTIHATPLSTPSPQVTWIRQENCHEHGTRKRPEKSEEHASNSPAAIPESTIYSYNMDDSKTPGGMKVRWKIRVIDRPGRRRGRTPARPTRSGSHCDGQPARPATADRS